MTLQEAYASDPKSVIVLRELRREIDSWEEVDPQSELPWSTARLVL